MEYPDHSHFLHECQTWVYLNPLRIYHFSGGMHSSAPVSRWCPSSSPPCSSCVVPPAALLPLWLSFGADPSPSSPPSAPIRLWMEWNITFFGRVGCFVPFGLPNANKVPFFPIGQPRSPTVIFRGLVPSKFLPSKF